MFRNENSKKIANSPQNINSTFSDEMLCYIFDFLKLRDLSQVSQVCRKWNELSSDSSVWKHRYEKDFAGINFLAEQYTFKEKYKYGTLLRNASFKLGCFSKAKNTRRHSVFKLKFLPNKITQLWRNLHNPETPKKCIVNNFKRALELIDAINPNQRITSEQHEYSILLTIASVTASFLACLKQHKDDKTLIQLNKILQQSPEFKALMAKSKNNHLYQNIKKALETKDVTDLLDILQNFYDCYCATQMLTINASKTA